MEAIPQHRLPIAKANFEIVCAGLRNCQFAYSSGFSRVIGDTTMVGKHIALVVWNKSTTFIVLYTMTGFSVLRTSNERFHLAPSLEPSSKSSALSAQYK